MNTDSVDNSNTNNELFDTLVILEFSVKVPPPAIQWIVDKIKLLKSKGGGELQVCPIVDENYEVCYVKYFVTHPRGYSISESGFG